MERLLRELRFLILAWFAACSYFFQSTAEAFSMSTPPPPTKTIYDVPNSGWTSPEWNWGYAMGTGHDCAAICRQKYASREERTQLITSLLDGDIAATNIEEIKLVLALKWQRNYRSGYGDVLDTMADARRYEQEENGNRLLLIDMKERFHLLDPNQEDLAAMEALDDSGDVESSLRQCSGLVLKTMGFADGW